MRKNLTKIYFLSPLLLLLSMAISPVYAQQASVSGQVLDAVSGRALSGVSVSVVGSNESTLTDLQGVFKLTVTSNGSLQFSYVGYETQRVSQSRSPLYIHMNVSSRDIEEVVVVAYGTSKRDHITGSVSTVQSKEIENRQVASISKALEGQVPGLQSVAPSGQPGTDADIRIRGIGSINASSAPLYVVDGNPYAGEINAINPNDIESISVLKDAASSALYGSRGANGVIIITTKKGSSAEETRVGLNLTQGFSKRAVRDYDQLSTDEYFELYWEALRNKSITNGLSLEQAANNATARLLTDLNINPYGFSFPQPVGLDGKLVGGARALWDDDWADVLQRTGSRTQADLSFAGGGNASTYFISGGYLNDEGMAIESGYRRYNLRANVDAKVKSWLNAGVNIAGASSLQKYPQSEDSNTANIVNFTRLVPSFYPYYERNPDGSYKLDENNNKIYDFGEYRPSAAIPRNNLAGSLPLDKNDIQKENISARTYLEASFSPNITFRTAYSLDYINRNRHDYRNPEWGGAISILGSVSRSNARTVGQTWSNILTYDQDFGVNHLNVLAGHEYYDFKSNNISGSRERFVLPGLYEPVAASQLNSFTGSAVDYKLLSFLGRVEYNYDSRYFLSSSLRTDGSSRFSPDKRWGTFWSVGGSWKISEESFLKDVSALNLLTLRASYGGQGNDNLGTYYAYQGLYTIANSLGEGGTLTDRLPTEELRWETNLNMNLGLDVSVFQNRVALTFEYFVRRSKDLLFTMPMPLSTGYAGYDANIGALKNVGFDVELRTIPVRKNDFRWDLDVNISHYKNKISTLPNNNAPIINGNKILQVGGSIYDFYLPVWAGVDPQNGLPQWYIADEEGNRTDQKTSEYSKADHFVVGTALPDLVGGVNNSFTYKNVDVSALLSFSLGGKVLDNDYIQLMHNGNNPGRAWSEEMLNRWTPENVNTDVPILTTDNHNWTSQSTRFLYDATYARLKNVSIGYTLPSYLASKIQVNRLRVFAIAENVFTFYKHQGMDPEQTVNGATYFRYPAMKTISGGVQLVF